MKPRFFIVETETLKKPKPKPNRTVETVKLRFGPVQTKPLPIVSCWLTLKDVRHVPDIRLNLILTGRLDEEGYSGIFHNGKWNFCNGSLIVVQA